MIYLPFEVRWDLFKTPLAYSQINFTQVLDA